jgi:phosphoserine phosphatase RsbU/P
MRAAVYQELMTSTTSTLPSELLSALGTLAQELSIGVAIDRPDGRREWLVPCVNEACAQESPKAESGASCAFRQSSTLESRIDGVYSLTLCSRLSTSAAVFDSLQKIARLTVERREILSREEPLLQELAASLDTIGVLYSVDLQSREDLQHVIDNLLDRAVAAGPDVAALFWVLDRDSLRAVAERRTQRPRSRGSLSGVIGTARLRGASLVFDDITQWPDQENLEPELRGAGSVAVIPVRTRQGLEAVLEVWRAPGQPQFQTPAVRLLETVALQAARAIGNDRLYRAAVEGERMRQELDMGASIQQHLLLGKQPQGIAGVEIANYMLPSLQVGGDFYQFIRHSDTCFDAIVGDVMGKGIGPALMGAATKSTLLRMVAEKKNSRDGALPELADIVSATNRNMGWELVNVNSFVTVFYARVDLNTRTLTYVDAGHTQTIHYTSSDGSIALLRGEGVPIGFNEAETYRQSERRLAPGDIVLIYSDGMSEACDPEGRQFGVVKIIDCLLKHASLSAAEIASAISSEIIEFRGTADLADDLTCLIVKIQDNIKPCVCRLVIHGHTADLRPLRDWVARSVSACSPVAVLEDTLFNIQLAVQEVATNIITHGLGCGACREIAVEAYCDGRMLHIKFEYDGVPFTCEAPSEPCFDGSRDNGFGLYIIDQLMDEATYAFADGRNTIRLKKRLDHLQE